MNQPVERRLAAILAADVAGYSRLMGVDEEGTHERLKAHLRELVDPKIKEHHGRIVKNTGDGMLVEFPSVINAVRCAAEVQRGMGDRNAETAEDKRITFRVGINLGDVIAEEDDIYGDGVNVAARLEALAEPGGICIFASGPRPDPRQAPIPVRGQGRAECQEYSSGRYGSSRCAPKLSLSCRRQVHPPWHRDDDVSSRRQRRRPLQRHSSSLSSPGGSGRQRNPLPRRLR